jgi:hypothetical protein
MNKLIYVLAVVVGLMGIGTETKAAGVRTLTLK